MSLTLNDPSLLHTTSLIAGAFLPRSAPFFPIADPRTDRTLALCTSSHGPAALAAALAAARAALPLHAALAPRARARLLLAWHALVAAHAADLAALVALETGKTAAEARAEVAYGQTFLVWFAAEAERVHGSVFAAAEPVPPTTTTATDDQRPPRRRRVLVVKRPVGVALALVPWNFPLALTLRKAAAALAAGCPVVIKPPPEAPLAVLALGDLALRAAASVAPPTSPCALTVLLASRAATPAVAEALCLHPDVAHVSFTGSTRVGRLVAGHCARALRRCTLELGGNCPFVVFDDADLDDAAAQLVALKWRCAGQTCTAPNRVYVQAGVHDELVRRFVARTRAEVVVGPGEDATMGALTVPSAVRRAEELVADALALGACLVLGGDGGSGRRLHPDVTDECCGDGVNGGGYFMEPTVLTGMTGAMRMTREEIFAPVCGVYRFETEEEVTSWANDTGMGLASYVFTKDVDRVFRLADNLEAGLIGVNTGNCSAAESPFGGMKMSGYGKESGKDVAIDEYLVAKTVTITLQG